ncbi:beta-ketoacyl-[acyl-carrier-protein] synthase family protein [Streptomyces sp. NPDC051546]|uniref:beta-ketoacyl-[acyl-carrier-protein] synthase family protein n=1 Tax=Streptomyces sp. NPDC051546 TaxID=3365655 RepID=UPI003795C06C
MHDHQPVAVITGLGCTTPLGGNIASTWSSLLAGHSGIRRLSQPWAKSLPVRIAAPAAVDPSTAWQARGARRLDRASLLALIAAHEAWADAGFTAPSGTGATVVDPQELAVVLGCGLGPQSTFLAAHEAWLRKGAEAIAPYALPMFLGNSPAAQVGLALGARAGVRAPVSACASGAEAVAIGLDLIRSGRAKVVVVGGTDAGINPVTLSSFAAMNALSTRNDAPDQACRPFDLKRDGFVLGEGSGVLVLEEPGFARSRGARPYCELLGSAVTSDSHHIAQPHPDGSGLCAALEMALDDAEVDSTASVRLVSAHATSTPQGDRAEARALLKFFAPVPGRIAVSAVKSGMGHLLGAAGAVECAVTALCLYHRVAPHVVNTENTSEHPDLNLIRGGPLRLPSGRLVALNNSLGFGGHNVVLALRSMSAACARRPS